eukprot:6753299-Prymnesium_polylepis.3
MTRVPLFFFSSSNKQTNKPPKRKGKQTTDAHETDRHETNEDKRKRPPNQEKGQTSESTLVPRPHVATLARSRGNVV